MEERGEFPNRPQWLKKPGVRNSGSLKNVDPGPSWGVGFTLLPWIFPILHFRQADWPSNRASQRATLFQTFRNKNPPAGQCCAPRLIGCSERRAIDLACLPRFFVTRFRATGTTVYLKNKGNVREGSEDCCLHESPPATMLSDRTDNQLRLDEIEKISV
jgi:hypothetical protein